MDEWRKRTGWVIVDGGATVADSMRPALWGSVSGQESPGGPEDMK